MENNSEKNNNYKKDVGFSGENRAAFYLEKNGYKILQRNFTIRGGELDIVAYKNDTLVIVEVKTLPNGNFETLKDSLNRRKIKSVIRTTKHFLQKYRQYSNSYIRFDVIALDLPNTEPVFHIENAFSEIL